MFSKNSAENLIKSMETRIGLFKSYIRQYKSEIEQCNEMIADLKKSGEKIKNIYTQAILKDEILCDDEIAKHEYSIKKNIAEIQRVGRKIDEIRKHIEVTENTIKLFEETIEKFKAKEKSAESIYSDFIDKLSNIS